MSGIVLAAAVTGSAGPGNPAGGAKTVFEGIFGTLGGSAVTEVNKKLHRVVQPYLAFSALVCTCDIGVFYGGGEIEVLVIATQQELDHVFVMLRIGDGPDPGLGKPEWFIYISIDRWRRFGLQEQWPVTEQDQ